MKTGPRRAAGNPGTQRFRDVKTLLWEIARLRASLWNLVGGPGLILNALRAELKDDPVLRSKPGSTLAGPVRLFLSFLVNRSITLCDFPRAAASDDTRGFLRITQFD